MTVLAHASVDQRRHAQIASRDAEVEAAAVRLARILERLFLELARQVFDERVPQIRKASSDRLADRATRIVQQQGMELLGVSARRASAAPGLEPRINFGQVPAAGDYLARLQMLEGRLRGTVHGQADRILAGLMEDRQGRSRRELARDFSAQLEGAMTFDRAITWARTEAAVATNTGAVVAYQAAGVERIEWLAFKAPIWPRRHDKLDGVQVDMGESFVMPVSGARLRWPHDPLGPVGETINCRCSHKPVRRPRRRPTPPTPPTTPPVAAPVAPPRGARVMPLEATSFDAQALGDALAQVQTSPRAQAVVREQTREVLRTRGFDPSFGADNRASTISVQSMAYAGMMEADGRMVLHPRTAADAALYGQGDRTVSARYAMTTILHEEIHAHGASWERYRHADDPNDRSMAIVIEELSTEMVARRLQNELDADVNDTERRRFERSGAYDGYQDQVSTILGRAIPSLRSNDVEVQISAAMRFKARRGGDQPTHARQAGNAYAQDLVDAAREQGHDVSDEAAAQIRRHLNGLDATRTRTR